MFARDRGLRGGDVNPFDDPWDEPAETQPEEMSLDGLLELLNAQAALLVSVATGGPRIQEVNAKYQKRRRKLNAGLRSRSIKPPFPYEDLWAWHGDWSANIPTYAARRVHISRLAAPAREALEAALEGAQVSDPGTSGHPTWASLDARVEGVVNELRDAHTLDDLQDVGRRCREVLIDAAKLLADPNLVPPGQDAPNAADAKQWLELFLARRAAGRSHRELRAFIPVAWDLAQKVTHGSVERVDAYAAAQATVLVVRSLQQLSDDDA
jgi:hypothetical protein